MKSVVKSNLAVSETRNFREQKHNVTNFPVKDILKERMAELGIKNQDLQKALGYREANVIAMMRNGSMRLPPKYAPLVATMLKVDKAAFMEKVMEEFDPVMWGAVKSIFKKRVISNNEMANIETMREMLDGLDINFNASQEFIASLKPVIEQLVKAEREKLSATLTLVEAGAMKSS